MFIAESEKRRLVAALSEKRVLVSENCPHAGQEEPGMRLWVFYATLTSCVVL